MPKATGSMEGFYRSSSDGRVSYPDKLTATPSPSRLSTEVTVQEFDITSGEALLQPDLTETASNALPSVPPSNPNLLIPSPEATSNADRGSHEASGGTARQRSSRAVLKSLSSSELEEYPQQKVCDLSEISMICTVSHRGTEMIFGSLPHTRTVLGLCARTHVVLQRLQIPDCHEDVTIVSLRSNPATGMISVALSEGAIQTYHPQPTTAAHSSSSHDASTIARAYGKYRWVAGPLVRCNQVFYDGGEERANLLTPRNLDISSSQDDKMLVTHRDQIALYDVCMSDSKEANLLWTTRLEATVVSAKLSGDGCAIVVVVDGDGETNENPYGARTFLRDTDDGSQGESSTLPSESPGKPALVKQATSTGSAVGLLYKPGPFLVHSASVSRISFRGFGHLTSSVHCDIEEGNDLLLTYCDEDFSVHIFSQNSWKQLMTWTTPPNSRADWVRGISAFNLGDLEARKKRTASSAPASRRPSISSGVGSEDVNAVLLGGRTMPTQPTTATPTTSAGAWIAELTFRNRFPALRLSRLSYMKRGNDESQPAHFESVAAILPASSLLAESVLGAGDMGLSVEGVWPASQPWSTGMSTDDSEGTLSGSAMAFLGLSSGPTQAMGMFGDSHSGGTHGPPSELRIVASHPQCGKVVLMEFPLWGDLDFGAMELGNPLRYVLSLSDATEFVGQEPINILPPVCTSYDSDVLCAQIEPRRTSVAIYWRRQGSSSILPAPSTEAHSISSSDSIDSSESYHKFDVQTDAKSAEKFQDHSVLPIPLALPALQLPGHVNPSGKEKIQSVHWWIHESSCGLPHVLAVTSSGSFILYELPPPSSALEPAMPNFDPFQISRSNSAGVSERGDLGSVEGGNTDGVRGEYDVMITPHPDFGIGLRLEAQMDGLPAIAGSYKKHPLNGGDLPAERTGMIVLGDELLSVNGVSLEGISFDDIISTVRRVGAESSKGEPLCMRFRPAMENRLHRANSANLSVSGASNKSDGDGSRRTMEHILGVSPKSQKNSMEGLDEDEQQNDVSMLVGAGSETQQQFSRVVAVVRDAVSQPENAQLAILPWQFSTDSTDLLIVVAQGCSLDVKCLQLSKDSDPNKASYFDIGKIDLSDCDESPDIFSVKSLETFSSDGNGFGMAILDENDRSRLVFCEIKEVLPAKCTDGDSGYFAEFRHYPVFECGSSERLHSQSLRASSAELLSTFCRCKNCIGTVNVWSARPLAYPTETKNKMVESEEQYTKCEFNIEEISDDGQNEIVDLRFVRSGSLDSFPWIVTMTQTAAYVHRRDGGSLEWKPVVTLLFPRNDLGSSHDRPRRNPIASPADVYPHLIPTLRSLVSACDESLYLRSDWHPDSILSYICTNPQGAGFALRHNVKGIFVWLSRWLDTDENAWPNFNSRFPLGVAPFRVMEEQNNEDAIEDNEDESSESAASFLMSLSKPQEKKSPFLSERQLLLQDLQQVLSPGQIVCSENTPASGALSDDAVATRDKLPPPLKILNRDELRLLWAVGEMITKPPKFKQMDSASQLALFCVQLARTLKAGRNQDTEKGTENESSLQSTVKATFAFIKEPQKSQSKEEQPSLISSSACLSALVSNTQGLLLEACRVPNEKLSWTAARELRLPLWLRSTDQLRKISEEIGQSEYKERRDILENALFFIIAGKTRTLRNLAATDQSDTGRMFLKFITMHDFSSDRGRKAAEKNAYSLLRKRRYRAAASFFLLPEPPMLKTALEIMVTQMQDFELAFLVARLVESSNQAGGSADGLSGIAIGGFSGMLGGGGGFASGTNAMGTSIEDEVKFVEWKPDTGSGTRSLINSRGMPLAASDACLKALQLIWLGRKEEGARCLSGLHTEKDDGKEQMDAMIPAVFSLRSPSEVPVSIKTRGHSHMFQRSSSGLGAPRHATHYRITAKANTILNFASSPFLLKAMEASTRSRWAGTLLVSRALSRRGIDLAAAKSILQNTDGSDLEIGLLPSEDDKESKTEKQAAGGPSSSIFDSFEMPKPPPSKNKTEPSGGASSIFDSFDVPPVAKKSKDSATKPQSSIFDSYDPAPPTKQAASSIFDAFDTAPQVAAQPKAVKSIFDDFDTAPQRPKAKTPASSSQQATMSSSIFDSFDTPAPARKDPAASVVSPPAGSQPSSNEEAVEAIEPDVPVLPTPKLWLEWRANILARSVARRLLREVARIVARFHGDAVDAPIRLFRRHIHPLVPSNVGEILHSHCDGEEIWASVKRALDDLCTSFKLDKNLVSETAMDLLSSYSQPNRIVFAVLLNSVMERDDVVESIIRRAASTQMRRCEAMTICNDELVDNRKTLHHKGSQYLRRAAARVSWQLELCLWLHRGETFLLSPAAIKESVIAVRTGLAVASWGRCHECLETMIRIAPDCATDDEAGRQLWSSMKLITGLEEREKKTEKVSSGGWEFLVDCRRGEATEMLRTRPPGSFLIRPHSGDTGVFTLSFKTNLVPNDDTEDAGKGGAKEDGASTETPVEPTGAQKPPRPNTSKPVRKDDVVQHAIVRLSDAGFRCGSFGPFASLMKLLEAVSSSLPFDLLFSTPPIQGVIKDEGSQPSPNAVFLRKFALTAHTDNYRWNGSTRDGFDEAIQPRTDTDVTGKTMDVASGDQDNEKANAEFRRRKRFGMFLQLLALSEIRKQLSGVAAAEDPVEQDRLSNYQAHTVGQEHMIEVDSAGIPLNEPRSAEQAYAASSRMVRPLISWCRVLEMRIVAELAPSIQEVSTFLDRPVDMAASETAIEIAPVDMGGSVDAGDSVIRRMIRADSGVEFRTIRVGEGGESAMIVLFSKSEAVNWFLASGAEKNEEDARVRLEMMEKRRVIEPVEAKDLSAKPVSSAGKEEVESVRYRFVDPWEVEVLESREAETLGASLGREHFNPFSVSTVARSCEEVFRTMGGLHLLGLWTYAKGGLRLTKAIASAHAPWDRDAGGDLQMTDGTVAEQPPFVNSIRQHLYRNALFRRLQVPPRFLALVQVEMLDLKNLTSPGGSPSLTVYALLRLKRPGSSAPLTHKARTLDSAATQPTKIGKSSGPNAPASWGSVARFRFPLPEDVNCDGVSCDGDREALFKGAPSVLQISVYEKRFMSDIALGGADVKLDALASGGQMEEWVPLRATKQGGSGTGGISWFARIRLTLRFELLCLESSDLDSLENDDSNSIVERPPSVGLRKIQQLSKQGGAHEDANVKRSASTPDIMSYIESMVY